MRETKQPPNRDINLLNQKGAPEIRSAFDLFFSLRQAESSHKENSHLIARHIGVGTVISAAASTGNPFSGQLFYP